MDDTRSIDEQWIALADDPRPDAEIAADAAALFRELPRNFFQPDGGSTPEGRAAAIKALARVGRECQRQARALIEAEPGLSWGEAMARCGAAVLS